MKHILYIGNQLSSGNKTATTIDTLSTLLRAEGYIVTTVSKKHNKVWRLLDMLSYIIKLRRKVDYVLIDTYSTTNFYYAYLCSQLCRVFKLKYMPILHGGNLTQRLKDSPIKSKQIFDNAYCNIAPSLYLLSNFKSYGYTNIKHIPNTIEIDNYNFLKRKVDTINLLWVRSFSTIYNPQLAVKLLKSLIDEGFNASLCMVGPDNDGSLKSTKLLAKELGVNVEFTGKLSKKEWIEKSKSYNIFINTTNIDNMPVSVIEAMALGLPVVSTNVGGLPFLIKNEVDGITVNPNNVNELKGAILKLKTHQAFLDKITTSARRKIEQYDWQVVKHKWFSELL